MQRFLEGLPAEQALIVHLDARLVTLDANDWATLERPLAKVIEKALEHPADRSLPRLVGEDVARFVNATSSKEPPHAQTFNYSPQPPARAEVSREPG